MSNIEKKSINIPHLINLPKIVDPRGNLSFLEEETHLPFKIARTFWIHDVPGGEKRGGHAYKTQQEFIIALSGSFDVVINTGKYEQRFHLNRSYYGLYVPAMIWREMDNFSTNSLALVVVDKPFNEEDYIRDFSNYNQLVNGQ